MCRRGRGPCLAPYKEHRALQSGHSAQLEVVIIWITQVAVPQLAALALKPRLVPALGLPPFWGPSAAF